MGGYQLLDQPSFVTLLEEHYAASPVDPADSPARWALVNAVIGLMLRAKIAPGAETELSRYPRAFYRNATAVIPELILQDPSLLSIQALLAMAMFAEATSDTRSFVMLATTASRQLELLLAANQGRVPAQQVLDMAERGQLERAYEIASAFETLAAQRYGIRSLLNSDEIEGSAL
ncbi:uncharacterized protein C8A04DRAFT_40520 [Dichotomopilus funicola]|uniref:Uncharacterized protein n=1 Tax=Dichotomopilus funicola TaxID=1934379 RepID=A0AAN6ZJH4_9PEZI|nr:hypothetical protein C8A04DRAFT_40520 [Dichotomopilus funicola]